MTRANMSATKGAGAARSGHTVTCGASRENEKTPRSRQAITCRPSSTNAWANGSPRSVRQVLTGRPVRAGGDVVAGANASFSTMPRGVPQLLHVHRRHLLRFAWVAE